MRLVVVRHAIAEDREVFAAKERDDSLRPLTPDGARKMRRGAQGLHEILPSIDVLASSAFTRAAQTAEIVREEYGLDTIETTDTLEPDQPLNAFIAWVGSLAVDGDSVVAVVGHEPHLSRLVTYLLTGKDGSRVELKKGAACLLEFEALPRAGGGKLIWAIPPAVLRDFHG